jgi:hypothetical protein
MVNAGPQPAGRLRHGIQKKYPEVVISVVIEVLDEIRPSAQHES